MKKSQPPLPKLPQDAECIDTHCHLDMDAYAADLDTVIRSASANGVTRIVTIGIDLASSRKAVALAQQYPNVYATIGFHPHDAQQVSGTTISQLASLRDNPRVVGYGEIGLDYVKQYAPREVQLKAFTDQLHLAKELDLPVVIHDREAHDDIYALIRSIGIPDKGGVMHCFSGDTELAKKMIDCGLYLSIPGVVTFANAASLQAVVRTIGLDSLLVETDGPFLAPVPFRGKRNEPAWVLYTAQMIAQLKEVPLSEVARITTANAIRLFRLPETARP